MPNARQKPVKTIGAACWSTSRGRIPRAILRDGGTLVMDIEYEGYAYAVALERRTGDTFNGTWSCHGYPEKGTASATLYTSSAGSLLFGEWVEDGIVHAWWAQLQTVDQFPDELQGG